MSKPSIGRKIARNCVVLLGCLALAGVAFGFDILGLMVGAGAAPPWPGSYPYDREKITAKVKARHRQFPSEHFWTY